VRAADLPAGIHIQHSPIEQRFLAAAATLDAAGLGPADYLYSALKWRLEHTDVTRLPLRSSFLKGLRLAIFESPAIPQPLAPAQILAASSYLVSANLLRKVVTRFEFGEATLCDATKARSFSRKSRDLWRSLLALGPACHFAWCVRAKLNSMGMGAVECNRIAEAAFVHALYRRAARAIIEKVQPKCLVIGNANRPFEFSLWAEAKARSIATVLLPFAEINLKPARILSLCRGAFDLALPFSEYSARQLCRLSPNVSIEVVGYPKDGDVVSVTNETSEASLHKRQNILYVSGNNFESSASQILKGAFQGWDNGLRVRLHPRNRESEIRHLFDWLNPDRFSNPLDTTLAEDIANARVVIAVRSTAALDALFAGAPLILLTPPAHRHELEKHPIRKQRLALLEASTSGQLRAIVRSLLDDGSERKRVVEAQWSRLQAAGYNKDYFDAVRSALRGFIGAMAQG
jgi:hypothetical protein